MNGDLVLVVHHTGSLCCVRVCARARVCVHGYEHTRYIVGGLAIYPYKHTAVLIKQSPPTCTRLLASLKSVKKRAAKKAKKKAFKRELKKAMKKERRKEQSRLAARREKDLIASGIGLPLDPALKGTTEGAGAKGLRSVKLIKAEKAPKKETNTGEISDDDDDDSDITNSDCDSENVDCAIKPLASGADDRVEKGGRDGGGHWTGDVSEMGSEREVAGTAAARSSRRRQSIAAIEGLGGGMVFGKGGGGNNT